MEIPWKQWATEQAIRDGVCREAIDMRIHNGRMRRPKVRRVNERVIFVVLVKEKREA